MPVLKNARVVWQGTLAGPAPLCQPIEARVVVGLGLWGRGAYAVEVRDMDALGGEHWAPLHDQSDEHRLIVATALAESGASRCGPATV